MTRRKGAFTRGFFVNKLCFLPLHLPKFFYAIIGLSLLLLFLTFSNLELVFRLVHDQNHQSLHSAIVYKLK